MAIHDSFTETHPIRSNSCCIQFRGRLPSVRKALPDDRRTSGELGGFLTRTRRQHAATSRRQTGALASCFVRCVRGYFAARTTSIFLTVPNITRWFQLVSWTRVANDSSSNAWAINVLDCSTGTVDCDAILSRPSLALDSVIGGWVTGVVYWIYVLQDQSVDGGGSTGQVVDIYLDAGRVWGSRIDQNFMRVEVVRRQANSHQRMREQIRGIQAHRRARGAKGFFGRVLCCCQCRQ